MAPAQTRGQTGCVHGILRPAAGAAGGAPAASGGPPQAKKIWRFKSILGHNLIILSATDHSSYKSMAPTIAPTNTNQQLLQIVPTTFEKGLTLTNTYQESDSQYLLASGRFGPLYLEPEQLTSPCAFC